MRNKEEPGPVPPRPLLSGVGGGAQATVFKGPVADLLGEFPGQSKSHGDLMLC